MLPLGDISLSFKQEGLTDTEEVTIVFWGRSVC